AVLDADGLGDADHAALGRLAHRPALSSAATKRAALPSMIGISGPSISTTALSRPRAAKAASTCSTVDTLAPSLLASTVQRRVSVTWSHFAGMTLSRSVMSVRRKVMPV